MYAAKKRNATVSVAWGTSVRRVKQEVRSALAYAILHPNARSNNDHLLGSLQFSITVDDEKQNDWEVARVFIGNKGGLELLFARMLVNEKDINVATEYALVLLGRQSGFGGKPVQAIARVEHPYTYGYRNWYRTRSYASHRWLNDWDEALNTLMVEAIGSFGYIP